MAQALRRVSVKRGYDPRDFTLLPCGGAGALIAGALAGEMGMNDILLPPHPGIFSAYGLAVADVRIDYVRADGAVRTDGLTKAAFLERIDDLRGQAAVEFSALGYDPDALDLAFAVDTRYVGQGYELRVPIDPDDVAREGAETLVAKFHALHEQQYNHSFLGGRVEAISFRLTAKQPRPTLGLEAPRDAAGAGAGTRTVSLSGEQVSYPVYQRGALATGAAIDGPAIVVEATTSTPVPPGWRLEVLKNSAVKLTRVAE